MRDLEASFVIIEEKHKLLSVKELSVAPVIAPGFCVTVSMSV